MNVQLCFILVKKKTLCTISPCRSGLKQGFITLGNHLHVLFLLNTALTVLWLSHILLAVLFFPIIIVSNRFFRIFSISATKIYIRCASKTLKVTANSQMYYWNATHSKYFGELQLLKFKMIMLPHAYLFTFVTVDKLRKHETVKCFILTIFSWFL